MFGLVLVISLMLIYIILINQGFALWELFELFEAGLNLILNVINYFIIFPILDLYYYIKNKLFLLYLVYYGKKYLRELKAESARKRRNKKKRGS